MQHGAVLNLSAHVAVSTSVIVRVSCSVKNVITGLSSVSGLVCRKYTFRRRLSV